MRLLTFLLVFSVSVFADDYWIHPGIEARLSEKQHTHFKGESDDFILIDGKKHFTGFRPSWEQYEDAWFRKVQAPTGPVPKEFDLRKNSYSPVRRQAFNDCWAQAAVSALEMTVNYIDKLNRLFSIQDVIDCSGFGTARNGGQMSMKHFEKGSTWETDYPYVGRDGRCNSGVTRREKVLRAFYGRGSAGKLPTLPELQNMVLQFGALEVCGAASSLGNGGRQDTIRGGRPDHCYALIGWLDGKALGWLDATYLIMKNSWGTGWGDKGFSYHPLAKGDGVTLKGSVITEIQGVEYKAMTPPQPQEFTLESWQVALEVKVDDPTKTDAVKAELQDGLDIIDAIYK